MSSRKLRYYDSATQTTTTAKYSFDKNKRYKWNKSSGAVEEITALNTLADDEITIAGSKSALRRMSDIERNVSILASKLGVAGKSNDDTESVQRDGDTMSGDLTISKTSPRIRLYDNDTANTTFGSIEWDSGNNQGVKLEFNEFDAELPVAGYGLVLGPSSTNLQFPNTGQITLNVLGEIYAGGTSLASLNKVWHSGNDGSGSGLDADTVDGIEAASFLRSDAADTATGKIDFEGSIVVSNPVGTGHVQMGNISNHSGNGYVRGSILFQRDQDQISYDTVTGSWTHAGGASTDWSMIAHTSGAIEFYNGPSSASSVTYTHADFETNFRWLSVNNISGQANRTVNMYSNLSVKEDANAANFYTGGELKATYNTNDGTTAVKGYGIEMSRVSSYLRPTTDGTQTLFIGGADATLDWNNVQIKTTSGVTVTGDFYATGDVCAYSTSDVSYKENIAPISNPLDKIMSIRGVEFDWNDDYVNTRGGVDGYFTRKHDVGVIAQEVETVMPEVVGTRPDGTKGVRYEKMVGLLIEAIKDQQQQIEELKSKLEGK